ncbi:hypothetical protein [Streptomyces sioyaensis]|uniref:hypothetical protein n=1 Tax=Streptomyces sioyaensis TaxID=67364 RepID=UPI00378A9A09
MQAGGWHRKRLRGGVASIRALSGPVVIQPVRTVLRGPPPREPRQAHPLPPSARTTFGVEAVPCASLHEATRGAQVICTTTTSSNPFLEPAAVDAGTHINAVAPASRVHASCRPSWSPPLPSSWTRHAAAMATSSATPAAIKAVPAYPLHRRHPLLRVRRRHQLSGCLDFIEGLS